MIGQFDETKKAWILNISNKKEMKSYFAKEWKKILKSYEMTAKQYDPHGTKKPVVYNDLIDSLVEAGNLPQIALGWKVKFD